MSVCLAATNQDLTAAVAAGRFREDLYFRPGGGAAQAPPLRERSEDIPLLCQAFCAAVRAGKRPSRKNPSRPEALAVLSASSGRANVRELRNVIERLVILSEDSIGVGDFARGDR